jgi:ABC-type spermidine/putrescine transport system permease subunit I
VSTTLDAPETAPPPSAAELEPPGQVKRLWPLLALPGTLWIVVFFAVPFYAIAAIAFGGTDPIFGSPTPEWNPWYWDTTTFVNTLNQVFTGSLRDVFVRTGVYVLLSLVLCVVIGYPVAYYIARYGGRQRGLLLALILAPWWINYITRMLAWINLLSDDGYVNRVLRSLHLIHDPIQWLSGSAVSVTLLGINISGPVIIALAYGYMPFMIVPLYATLDRIDERQLEASRDLGSGRIGTFLRVTLPLSRNGLITAIVITALPMFGDYYTNTLVSGSPTTTMVGNEIEFYLLGSSQKAVGASLVLILSIMLMLLMAYYLVTTSRASKEGR